MENYRTSRKLDIASTTAKTDTTITGASLAAEESFSKENLKLIFQNEIDQLVNLEIKSHKELFVSQLNEKFDVRLKQLENEYHNKHRLLEEKQVSLSNLVNSLTLKYQEDVSNNIQQMDAVLIEIVMESLYKILGEKEIYEKSVAKVVNTVINKRVTNTKVSIKVSEDSFLFLSQLYKDNLVLNDIQIDNSLTAGQIRIDDGVSIVATGLIDQLDYLKNILLGQLRDIHGL